MVRPVWHAHPLDDELLSGNCRLPFGPCGGQTIEAIVLTTDSGTARVISAGSQQKQSGSSVQKEIESSRLW
jgi:hypothetical protein